MSARSCRAFRIAIVAFLGLAPWLLAGAQDSLQSQLTEKFKLAKLGTDSTGLSIIETGTVLVIKKGGILGVPPSASIRIPSYVKDGQVKTANNTAMAGVNKLMSWKHVSDPTGTASTDTKFLTVDEKVYASKIDVNVKDSKVTLTIIECDSCNQVKDASSRRAKWSSSFPRGISPPPMVARFPTSSIRSWLSIPAATTISRLRISNLNSRTRPLSSPPLRLHQPPLRLPHSRLLPFNWAKLPMKSPGLFGPPTKIINLGTKIIYVYKDMKVTFIKSEVTDVQ